MLISTCTFLIFVIIFIEHSNKMKIAFESELSSFISAWGCRIKSHPRQKLLTRRWQWIADSQGILLLLVIYDTGVNNFKKPNTRFLQIYSVHMSVFTHVIWTGFTLPTPTYLLSLRFGFVSFLPDPRGARRRLTFQTTFRITFWKEKLVLRSDAQSLLWYFAWHFWKR